MDRGKLVSAALVFSIGSLMAMMPPLTGLFQWHARFFGLPIEVIYLFVAWAGMVVGALLLSRAMPGDPPSPDGPGGGP